MDVTNRNLAKAATRVKEEPPQGTQSKKTLVLCGSAVVF
jgi:hypothetical protein